MSVIANQVIDKVRSLIKAELLSQAVGLITDIPTFTEGDASKAYAHAHKESSHMMLLVNLMLLSNGAIEGLFEREVLTVEQFYTSPNTRTEALARLIKTYQHEVELVRDRLICMVFGSARLPA